MERTRALIALAAAAFIVILLGALALSYMSLSSANDELKHYKEQERQTALAITALHMKDTQAARSWWASTHQAEYLRLQNEGITVEASYIDTPYYTAVLDPGNPYYVNMGPPGEAEPGEVIVWLGQYFTDNMTVISSEFASYHVNATTHEVAGFTASTAHDIAYDNYVNGLAQGIYNNLGVSAGSVLNAFPATLDTSYLPETGAWLDVTEYRYQLRNTDVPAYLTVKTYVNSSTGAVTGVEISQPYYTTQSTIIH